MRRTYLDAINESIHVISSRLVLCPSCSKSTMPWCVQVFAGSFRGKVLFENPEFIHPNAVRSYEKNKEAGVYKRRKDREAASKEHKAAHTLPEDKLSNKNVFAAPGQDDEDSEEDVLDEALLDADGDALQHAQRAREESLHGSGASEKSKKKKDKKKDHAVDKGKGGQFDEESEEGDSDMDLDGDEELMGDSEDEELPGFLDADASGDDDENSEDDGMNEEDDRDDDE